MFVLPLHYPLPRRAFHPGWVRMPARAAEPSAAQRPAMDAVESDAAYTLTFDLPGLTREQVKVAIDRREVSIEAAADDTAAPEGARLLHRERRVPRFARRIELPVEIDAAASQARFADGVLTLTLAKAKPAGAHVVPVQ